MTPRAILSLFLILVCVESQDPDLPNYFVDIYEGSVYYAYPPDICITTGVLTKGYFMYECLETDNNTFYMQRTEYENDECTGDSVSETTFSHNDTWDNGVYEFNCGGTNTSAVIEVCTGIAACDGSCGGFGGTTYSIPGICHYGGNGTSNVYRRTNCNGTNGDISWYSNSTYSNSNCSNDDATVWTTNYDECSYFSEVYAAQFASYLTVYAQLTSCVINGVEFTPEIPTPAPTPEPTYNSTAADSEDNAIIYNHVFALIIGLLQLLMMIL